MGLECLHFILFFQAQVTHSSTHQFWRSHSRVVDSLTDPGHLFTPEKQYRGHWAGGILFHRALLKAWLLQSTLFQPEPLRRGLLPEMWGGCTEEENESPGWALYHRRGKCDALHEMGTPELKLGSGRHHFSAFSMLDGSQVHEKFCCHFLSQPLANKCKI